jgi:signal transduction histidine kinase
MLIVVAGGFATQAVGRQIRLNKMKNDFIATVSHELKTPLASMRVLVDTLLEGNIKDESQTEEYLRLTSKENQRLSRMIDNFLTFSRMERNKKAFTIVDCPPAAIAQDAIEAVKTKYAANNCQLKIDIADNLPEIQADHDAMVTVLVNLLDNACKYTGDNKQIAIKVFVDAGCVCFAVSDNGIGLARRHIRRIFDSFYQVDNTLARKAEGCGLGLSIVKFIVDAHKGKIAVESKPDRGSTFTVKIPLRPKQAD